MLFFLQKIAENQPGRGRKRLLGLVGCICRDYQAEQTHQNLIIAIFIRKPYLDSDDTLVWILGLGP